MATDAVRLEVLRSHFDSITEDMARVLERTALSTFIKEIADYAVAIVATNGELVSFPWIRAASSTIGANIKTTLNRCLDPKEGDIYLTNDAYLGGPVASHLPDLHMLRPVFRGESLICWLYANIHAGDVGGSIPGSVWSQATEIYQEGVRIRPTKLYSCGTLNESVKQLILDNTRTPEVNWGDITAMVNAMRTGDGLLQKLWDKFGVETVVDGMNGVLDYAADRGREILRTIPDGKYSFVDYLEDDFKTEVPVRIKVTVEVEDGNINLDFTGTDPQVEAALNLASGGESQPFLILGIIAFLVSIDPDIPKSSAIVRSVTVSAPKGSLLNAQFPAAIGVRYASAMRVTDAVLGALAEALPTHFPAGSCGMVSPTLVSVPDYATGMRKIQVVEPLVGGGGGRFGADGLDGVDGATAGFLRNTPVESVENELPIIVRRYCLEPDTGGAGQFRGGSATRLELEALEPGTIVVARGLERFRLRPYGVAGGRAGSVGSYSVIRRDGRTEHIGKLMDAVHLDPGDVAALVSPSGGGYGEPKDRPVHHLQADVDSGLTSRRRATVDYAADISADGAVSMRTPSVRPAAASLAGGEALPFDLGPERRAQDVAWPQQLQDELSCYFDGIPIQLRHRARLAAYRLWTADGAGFKDAASLWDAVFAELRWEVKD